MRTCARRAHDRAVGASLFGTALALVANTLVGAVILEELRYDRRRAHQEEGDGQRDQLQNPRQRNYL